ncbi:hypothetical protein [Sphingopyxis sp. GW247-27LB]|jgi:hypothetical protein|uniref:hypothetical protein n=1 Tax=Sphingopyxis sp. GW247-27LB TaxID=2012632 RepID=UPI000BA526DD|nr:hypothetical protein [Sphingopyxis sp. GW247-27LB]PAL25405.1 hypothetical protein CD928_02685 [Sphingopyxis sp. GW247-27LB]
MRWAFLKLTAITMLALANTTLLPAYAQTANGSAPRSLAIVCLPVDVTAAEKLRDETGEVRAIGEKHLVAFGIALDVPFPHQSVQIFDPDKVLPAFTIGYVGGNPPNMEIVGNNGDRRATLLFNLDNRNGAKEGVVMTFDGDSKPPQILSGTCTRELKLEAFDQLEGSFETYQAKWAKAQSK